MKCVCRPGILYSAKPAKLSRLPFVSSKQFATDCKNWTPVYGNSESRFCSCQLSGRAVQAERRQESWRRPPFPLALPVACRWCRLANNKFPVYILRYQLGAPWTHPLSLAYMKPTMVSVDFFCASHEKGTRCVMQKTRHCNWLITCLFPCKNARLSSHVQQYYPVNTPVWCVVLVFADLGWPCQGW